MGRRAARLSREGPDLSDETGLREAWSTHAGELFGYAYRSLGDRHAAEEAVQETFLRAWRAADRYDPTRPLRPWLFAILRNVVVDETRSRAGRAAPHPDEPEPAPGDGVDPLESSVNGLLVSEALRRIGPDHRTVLVETYFRGRTYAEVSQRLGIPEGTARSRTFYALRAMRVALEEMGWEG